MASFIINKWLNEIPSNGSSLAELLSNAGLDQIDRIIESIFVVLEDRKYHDELIETVCQHLFCYYRVKTDEFRRFVLIFLPTLISLHLTTCSNPSERRKYHCVEILLLGIYNLEVVDDDGQPIVRTFRLPLLVKPSIFHEPPLNSLNQSSMLTEHALSKLESGSGDINISVFGPFTEYEHIVSSNRMEILLALLKVYNENISLVPKQSLNAVCRMCFKILRHGFGNKPLLKGNTSPQIPIRYSTLIPLSSKFLVELVNSIYFCMYNDVADAGLQALDEIHSRAINYLYTDVILMTNAIKNALVITTDQLADSSMGINVALSPTSTSSFGSEGVSKAAITNASFKTKKLPDDIPIVTNNQLNAINEECEEQIIEKTGKPAMIKAGLGKLLKEMKEKKEKKDSGKEPEKKNKIRNENGDVGHHNKVIQDDLGSETTGVQDGKLSFNEEAIPLSIINSSNKPFDQDDDDMSSSSNSSSSDAASVPLVNNNDSVQNSISINDKAS